MTTNLNKTPLTVVRAKVSEARDDLRARREARAHYRSLERELSTYSSSREVDDLLAALHDDSAEAEMIRTIVTRNLTHNATRNLGGASFIRTAA